MFTPRNYTDTKQESVYLLNLLKFYKSRSVTPEELRQYIKYHAREKREADFLSCLVLVEEGKVMYTPEHLHKKLGGIEMNEFENKLLLTDVLLIEAGQHF